MAEFEEGKILVGGLPFIIILFWIPPDLSTRNFVGIQTRGGSKFVSPPFIYFV